MRYVTALLGLSILLTLTGCLGSESSSEDNPQALPEPQLITLTPATSQSVNRSRITLQAEIRDLSPEQIRTVTLGFADETRTLALNGSHISASLVLKPGNNPYTLTVTDRQGHSTAFNGELYFGNRTAAGNAHSGLLHNGQLYTWGRNNYGQTGLGFSSALSSDPQHPVTPQLVVPQPDNPASAPQFVSLAFNQNASLALDHQGYAWAWGETADGQLGLGDAVMNNPGLSTPQKIPGVSNVVAVSRGYDHSLLLTADGSVYSFGRNHKGQLGTGDQISRSTPAALPLSDIIQIGAGANTSFALDRQGVLWGWGSNGSAELARTDSSEYLQPVQISLPQAIRQFAAGKSHVLALTQSGDLYGWGLNSSSQIYGPDEGRPQSPLTQATKLDLPDDITGIWANGNMSFLSRSNGRIYPWGQNSLGGLGVISADNNVPYPSQPMTGLEGIRDLGVGALHGIALRHDGQAFSWGWSFEGSLGQPDVENAWSQSIPLPLTLPAPQ